MQITRETRPVSLTLTTSSDTSPSFPYSGFAAGQVHVPVGSGITQLTWYTSPDDVTYYAAYSGAGDAVTSTIAAGESCLIPVSLLGCAFLKAVVTGGSAGIVTFTLKS